MKDWLKGIDPNKIKKIQFSINKKQVNITEFNYLRLEQYIKDQFGDIYEESMIGNYIDGLIDMFFINVKKGEMEWI